MKATSLIRLTVLALVISVTAVGCQKKPQRVTQIPGLRPGGIGEKMSGPLDAAPMADNKALDGQSIPLSAEMTGWIPSAEQPFRGDTIYFDFDKAVVKASEMPKIERVAAGMKNYAGKAVRIEGHCDERGTEEYNRSLGERRALEVRSKLVTLGNESGRVDTISYGEDRPAEPGHDAAAWAKNRRAMFVLIEPPSSASAK